MKLPRSSAIHRRTFLRGTGVALALPLLLLGGFHLVMKYLIKGSHHLGRLSALAGICSVRKRNF